MVRTYTTIPIIKTAKSSNLISLINDIRAGSLSSKLRVYPKPRLRWIRSKTFGEDNAAKFSLRVRFTNVNQRDDMIPFLNKRCLIGDTTKLAANEVDISPSENGEDVKVVLEELVSSCIEKRINSSEDGKHLLSNVVEGPKKNIIVEFGSPNIAKPLHMGHLRSTVTGHYVARICRAAGHHVTTMCYLGDWGSQFGHLQAGLAKWLPGESVLDSLNNLELESLLKYYVKAVKEQEINEYFAHESREYSAALEEQNTEALAVWSVVREKTLRHLENVWKQLGLNYDVIQGESQFATKTEGTQNAIRILKENGSAEVTDGCLYGIIKKRAGEGTIDVKVPLLKADGSSLYLLRDIAAAISRHDEFKFDQMIYVVDKTQTNHFLNLFSILCDIGVSPIPTMGELKNLEKLVHISFGKIEGMSTRSGNFVLFSDVIRDGTLIMEEHRLNSPNVRNVEDSTIAGKLALSSLIAHFLRVRRNKDCQFEWTEALRPNGDTGVRLQYTHSRLKSLEEKLNIVPNQMFESEFNVDYILNEPIALDLALHLANFEDAFSASYEELEASTLLTYMFKLCDKTSKALKELRVMNEPDEMIAKTRLLLFLISRKTLAVGLDIVGIEPLDQI